MAGDTERKPFRASNSEMGSKPGGTESVPCKKSVKEKSGFIVDLNIIIKISKKIFLQLMQLGKMHSWLKTYILLSAHRGP